MVRSLRIDDAVRDEMNDACFNVRDATGQALAYVYFEEEPGRRSAAKLLTRDEAPRGELRQAARTAAAERRLPRRPPRVGPAAAGRSLRRCWMTSTTTSPSSTPRQADRALRTCISVNPRGCYGNAYADLGK
jgi:hypothetical protein